MCIVRRSLCKALPIPSSPCPSTPRAVDFCEAPHCSALPPRRARYRLIGFRHLTLLADICASPGAPSRSLTIPGESGYLGRLAPRGMAVTLTARQRKDLRSGTGTLEYAASHRGRLYSNPTLIVERGERVRIRLANALPEPTIVHWHGLSVSASNDGNGSVLAAPGETLRLRFRDTQSSRPCIGITRILTGALRPDLSRSLRNRARRRRCRAGAARGARFDPRPNGDPVGHAGSSTGQCVPPDSPGSGSRPGRRRSLHQRRARCLSGRRPRASIGFGCSMRPTRGRSVSPFGRRQDRSCPSP